MFDPLIPDGIELRVPPTEFRVFSVGVNETEKGDFLFDEEAAKLVMAAWAERKIDLSIDYEHQSLATPPMEAPNAATKWVPEIRNGELWATQVRWTDRALGYLISGEYRYFSPAFEYDDKTGRVTQLINIALTNNPAMRGITPLVAATAREAPVDYEKLYQELKAEHEQLKAKLSASDAKIGELTAALAAKKPDDDEEEKEAAASINATLSLRASARARERAQAVSQIATLRASIRTLTGAESDAAAIGILSGWKEAAAKVAALTAKIEEQEAAQLAKDFEAVLDEAGQKGTLEPARRAELKEQALKFTGGKLTRESVEMARAFLSARPKVVNNDPTRHPAPAGDASQLHAMQLHIAKICGRDPVEVARHQAHRNQRSAS